MHIEEISYFMTNDVVPRVKLSFFVSKMANEFNSHQSSTHCPSRMDMVLICEVLYVNIDKLF